MCITSSNNYWFRLIDKNSYPQTLLEGCKHSVKDKIVKRFVTEYLTDSISDSDSDNEFIRTSWNNQNLASFFFL